MTKFLVIQGCPCNSAIAPYLALLAHETKSTVNSIYRGEDAAWILHRHGKHTQAELYKMEPGLANPPGRSTHELRNDGVAYRGPVGERLEWWQQGIDVNDENVHLMIMAAERRRWKLFKPYSRGAEFHHLNFESRPVARGRDKGKLLFYRYTLPRN